MIKFKFTIEFEIGLFFPLSLASDRKTKTRRRGQSKQAYGYCRRSAEILKADERSAGRRCLT